MAETRLNGLISANIYRDVSCRAEEVIDILAKNGTRKLD